MAALFALRFNLLNSLRSLTLFFGPTTCRQICIYSCLSDAFPADRCQSDQGSCRCPTLVLVPIKGQGKQTTDIFHPSWLTTWASYQQKGPVKAGGC